ncbi:Putative Nonribosomal peptide synthetase [Podospora comata]|uniref:Nonribosomal peptide synthetase n=1 Tax=Podospora comata TaxID=48703 RepID=A0ABY6SIW8_PODCO|nr:Putative Nonribosomal peptide synthetase [Podospora comata]
MSSLTYVVDELAAEVPHDTWVKIPSSPTKIEEITWQNFTFQQLGQAVDRLAHWIDKHLGPAGLGRDESLAYTGINDIRYPIVILAALKTGHKSLLLSPRNSVEGHCALITSTRCAKLLHSQELSDQASEIGQKLGHLSVLRIPDLEHLLKTTTNPTPYQSKCNDKTPDHETVMILHSSGTTGLPKPIPLKAGVLTTAGRLLATLPTPAGRLNTHDPLYTTPLILSMPPFFHAFGINLLVRSLHYRRPLVLLPPSTPPTAELMLHAVKTTRPTGMVCTPSILEDICSLPHGIETLRASDIECIYSGGAPLARSCGNVIVEELSPRITLVNGIGTTEIWNATGYAPLDPRDWEYFEWNPAAGVVMEGVGGDKNTAELVIKRLGGEEGRFQFVFYNFPESEEWRTKDLFERHPLKETLWRYVGRVDDVIVLSNGEKLNPVTFEKMVEGHSIVKGAVMVGSGRFQTGLIVEVRDVSLGVEEVVERIWERVEEANEQYPAHARVWKSMVRVARQDKPFERTPKGTVMRRNTYVAYQAEIEEMYASAMVINGVAAEGVLDETMILAQIRDAVNSVIKRRGDVTDDTNLFALGFDSLQVLQLIRTLKGTVQSSLQGKFSLRLVYENPSISQLHRALCSAPATATTNTSRADKFDALIKEYTPSLRLPRPSHTEPKGFKVILTGTTGTLGSSLLSSLLANPTITHIYCLNRSKPISPNTSQVTFLQTDLLHPTLGLSSKTYNTLKHPQLLIHSAWPVNFNLPFDSFLPSISGTANLMALNPAKFVFISSIATAMAGTSPVPENFTQDHNLPNSVIKRRGDVTDDTNLFALGFDSLQVLQLIRTLKGTVQSSLQGKFSLRLVYENPSISQLHRALCSAPATATTNTSRADKFDALIKEYTPSLRLPRPSHTEPKGFKVILTGTTGTLGSSLLSSLLANPTITHIYCLNRSKPISPNTSQVTFLQTDLLHPTLGLSSKTYNTLKHPQLLIHSAWPVNFNLPFDSFLPSISGTANLMALNPAKFVFISSIATAMAGTSPVPENFTQDHNLPLSTGYAESKHLASCVLANSPIPSTILRVGQLAGRADGKGRRWNKHEWVPSLVQTSLNMGMIPSTLGGNQKAVDWIPVDLAAEAIVELGLGGSGKGRECYNVVNPSCADWEGTMVGAVQEYAGKTERGELKVVGVAEWLDALGEKNDAERYPALKLKEFFEGWRDERQGPVIFQTDKAKKTSQTMGKMAAVTGEMMSRWLDAWAF